MNLPPFCLKIKTAICHWLGEKKSLLCSLWSLSLLFGFLFLGAAVVKSKTGPTINLRQILGFKELLPPPAPYPVNQKVSEPPELSASSIMAIDVDSMVTLSEKNSDQRHFPASTTKIMTAMVALENYSLDQVLTVTAESIKVDGNLIKLVPGEQMTVESLLYGLLVGSGNDAALVLAENFQGGTTDFVVAMNKKAQDWKLENTHFTNPVGFDEEGHFSTARDLARLAIIAIKNPLLAQIVSTPGIVITDVSGQKTHFLKNTNELVGKLAGVHGVKTGWTENAGECLITLTERNGEKVMTVILGSKDRFRETQTLIEWIFQNFTWQTLVPASYR